MPALLFLAAGAVTGILGTLVTRKIAEFFHPVASGSPLPLPTIYRPGRPKRSRVAQRDQFDNGETAYDAPDDAA
ncbi:MAG: hypothetical protein JNM56_11960 [Planctomycetia bacterium]|nr:hypothetical protein [Planctomycetia bacterium]